jgi:hypothetical protein
MGVGEDDELAVIERLDISDSEDEDDFKYEGVDVSWRHVARLSRTPQCYITYDIASQ